MLSIPITKEAAIELTIRTFGAATKENMKELIEVLSFEISDVLNSNRSADLPYIEANQCFIGFLYSALRDMEFHSNDLPFNLN